MAKKKDLTSLANTAKQSKKDEAPAETSKKPTLVDDMTSLGKGMMSQDSKKTAIIREVDTGLIIPFPYRDRSNDWNNPSKYKDLIASIKTPSDQIHPAIVRRVEGNKDARYELITGWRRYLACKHNDIPLTVEVRNLTDREAVQIITSENADREDACGFELALQASKLSNSPIYNGASSEDIIKDLNIKKSAYYKYLTAAKVSNYPVIFNLLKPAYEVNINKAHDFAKLLASKHEDMILDYAKKCVEEGVFDKLQGKPNKVLEKLIEYAKELHNPNHYIKPVSKSIKIAGGIKVSFTRNRKGEMTLVFSEQPKNLKESFLALINEIEKP